MTRQQKLQRARDVINQLTPDECIQLLMEARPFITVQQLSQMLGIGINQAYALAKRKDFYPAVKVSERRIVINQHLLDQWMTRQPQYNSMP